MERGSLESLLKVKVGEEHSKISLLIIPILAAGKITQFLIFGGLKALESNLAKLLATKPNQPPR